VCFLASSLALLAISSRSLIRYASAIGGVLASVLIAMGTVSVLGYLLGHTDAYGWSHLTGMAFHTSGCFVLSGVGLLAWAWQESHDKKGVPEWLPLSIGLGLAAGVLGVWQALMRHEESDLPLLSAIILAGGILGSLLVAIAVAQTLEARRRSRELQEGKDVLERVFEAPPDALLLTDRQGRILRVNNQVEKIFGYAPDELLGAAIEALVPLKLRETHRPHREGYYASPSPRPMGRGLDLHARRKDGSEFPVEISLGPVQSGGETQVLAVVRDITERQQVQEALRLSEERLSLATRTASIGIWDWDLRSNLTVWDDTIFEIFGIPKVVPMAYEEFARRVHPDDLAAVEAWLQRAIQGKTQEFMEFRIIRPDGSVRHLSSAEGVVLDEHGNVVRMVGTAVDITGRKEMEAQIEASREQIAASARLSALGMMAGGVAHEINNPLAIIHASAADLLRRIKDEGAVPVAIAKRNSERILETANRITRIIKSMRHLAREGSQDRVRPASVAKIVEETLEVCEERFKYHSVNLLLPNIDPALLVSCREVQIGQVLLNLLQNAFDAVVDLPGEKWIRLEVTADDGSVVFSVIDSGPGIPPELKPKIMEPFFTTKEVGKGTGLGLSLSRTIVEEHGGKLELADAAGHPCFSFRIPLAQKEEPVCN
jgi:PAS domain S-box-containing protein